LEEEVKEKDAPKPRQVVAGKGDTNPSEPPAMAQLVSPHVRNSGFRDNYTLVKLSRKQRLPSRDRATPWNWPLSPLPFSPRLLR